jgi:hypothetical protein
LKVSFSGSSITLSQRVSRGTEEEGPKETSDIRGRAIGTISFCTSLEHYVKTLRLGRGDKTRQRERETETKTEKHSPHLLLFFDLHHRKLVHNRKGFQVPPTTTCMLRVTTSQKRKPWVDERGPGLRVYKTCNKDRRQETQTERQKNKSY